MDTELVKIWKTRGHYHRHKQGIHRKDLYAVVTKTLMTFPLLGRNHMCVRSQAVPNATQTPALSGSMLRRSTDPKPTSPRNNGAMHLRGCSHPKATGRMRRIPSSAQEVWTARLRPTATLEEWRTAYKSNLSRLRTLWWVLII